MINPSGILTTQQFINKPNNSSTSPQTLTQKLKPFFNVNNIQNQKQENFKSNQQQQQFQNNAIAPRQPYHQQFNDLKQPQTQQQQWDNQQIIASKNQTFLSQPSNNLSKETLLKQIQQADQKAITSQVFYNQQPFMDNSFCKYHSNSLALQQYIENDQVIYLCQECSLQKEGGKKKDFTDNQNQIIAIKNQISVRTSLIQANEHNNNVNKIKNHNKSEYNDENLEENSNLKLAKLSLEEACKIKNINLSTLTSEQNNKKCELESFIYLLENIKEKFSFDFTKIQNLKNGLNDFYDAQKTYLIDMCNQILQNLEKEKLNSQKKLEEFSQNLKEEIHKHEIKIKQHKTDVEMIKMDVFQHLDNIVLFMGKKPFKLIISKYKEKIQSYEQYLSSIPDINISQIQNNNNQLKVFESQFSNSLNQFFVLSQDFQNQQLLKHQKFLEKQQQPTIQQTGIRNKSSSNNNNINGYYKNENFQSEFLNQPQQNFGFSKTKVLQHSENNFDRTNNIHHPHFNNNLEFTKQEPKRLVNGQIQDNDRRFQYSQDNQDKIRNNKEQQMGDVIKSQEIQKNGQSRFNLQTIGNDDRFSPENIFNLRQSIDDNQNILRSPNNAKYLDLLDKVNNSQANTNYFYQQILKEHPVLSPPTNQQKYIIYDSIVPEYQQEQVYSNNIKTFKNSNITVHPHNQIQHQQFFDHSNQIQSIDHNKQPQTNYQKLLFNSPHFHQSFSDKDLQQ